mmetsp:Transcript_13019/g.23715  ORF Transcript_13019/g.23715 Transcript_13019/m.23715 type:complete len:110 (+) Transcript_13019:60-389(+)
MHMFAHSMGTEHSTYCHVINTKPSVSNAVFPHTKRHDNVDSSGAPTSSVNKQPPWLPKPKSDTDTYSVRYLSPQVHGSRMKPFAKKKGEYSQLRLSLRCVVGSPVPLPL